MGNENNGFRGLQSSSSILAGRQKDIAEQYKTNAIDDIVEHARTRVLKYIKDTGEEKEIGKEIKTFIEQECPTMTYSQKDEIVKQILDELRGFGPLSDLMADPEVSDILVVNYQRVLYEKKGVLHAYEKDGAPVVFRSPTLLRLLIERLCMMGHGRMDESQPYAVVNVEGTRVTVAIPPISLEPTIAIRKFVFVPTLDDLVASGSLTPDAAEFMRACSVGRRNLAFVGGMGTGKTTMIATLGRFFGEWELPILVEASRECPLEHPNLRIMVARQANIEGKGEIGLGKLLVYALTMRATRVLVSEAKAGEAFYCLQAQNIGHDGSIFTFHASSAADAIYKRLPSMVMMSPELSDQFDPMKLIGNALHFVCMLDMIETGPEKGKRFFREISEVAFDGERCEVRPVFRREEGALVATGYVPEKHIEEMKRYGVQLSRDVFRQTPDDFVINL